MAISGTNYDFLIIGQGLAGSILAYCLINRGKRVMVIDNDHHASSSRVAAGIINPITGKKLNISENFDAYYSTTVELYTRMGKEINTELFQAIPQKRIIVDQAQYGLLQQRLKQSKYKHFFNTSTSSDIPNIDASFGSIQILKTGLVDTKSLLDKTKKWLIEQSSYGSLKFDYDSLSKIGSDFCIDNIMATNIIFCEGYQAINNPWLKGLPFKLAKGEIITIKHDHCNLNEMLNWGKWLVPCNDRQAKIGSNFVWDDLNLEPDPITQASLLESLQRHTAIKANTINTEVGIRPATRHREPFVGSLNKLTNAYCFNGFGSKGCLQIPYYAELLCDHITEQKPLPTEITQWL